MQAIKSVNVMSCAKMLGAIYGAMGLLAFPISLIAGFASMASGQRADTVGGVAMVAFGFFAPFLYGGLGFVVGALGAWIYNIMAKWLGGIQIELQIASPAQPVTANRMGLI
ncbi:MAG: hypothetical protein DMG73_07645 [Acidobacteria bacterium]|nr:MAG: hypothetical protein DMG73_07645 [Acidobacteriota bacterium]